jgi:glycerol-3-phosphate responsive antiterminator
MASDQNFVDFVTEQIQNTGTISTKKEKERSSDKN